MEKFLTSLFDFEFVRFVTPTIIKFLYIVAVVGVGIAGLAGILTGFQVSVWVGIVSLILAPIVFIVEIALIRLLLEMVVNIYRIANYSAELARAQRKKGSDAGGEEDDVDTAVMEGY